MWLSSKFLYDIPNLIKAHLCNSSVPLHHYNLGPDVIFYTFPFAVHLNHKFLVSNMLGSSLILDGFQLIRTQWIKYDEIMDDFWESKALLCFKI